jgi:N-methylhydantoinase A
VRVSWVIGSDTGGTFTDLVALGDDGELRIAKVPSTPPAFERGVLDGIDKLGVRLADVRTVFHATTATTNAAITRTGAKTALITTAGFRDILELRRSDRADLYDILWDPPPPLIRRRDRLEVRERVDYAGTIVEPLDERGVVDAARALRARHIEAVAVCLINAFANPAHERRVRELLRAELPSSVHVSISTDILPEPPEFERTATTVANAYLAPVLGRYLSELDTATRRSGYTGRFVLVMHNAGGTMSAEYATGVPVRTLQSGPAGGAIAGAAVARGLDRDRVVCLDMGGTSADVSLVLDGKPLLTQSSEAEWGLPIRFPAIDVVSVGAGGGSIAWVDQAGTPKSGPESAGAIPGPACYGRGGERPTTTDAHLVLGNLGTRARLGGDVALDHDLASRALSEHFARPLGLELDDAAEAAIRVANANLARPLRLLTIERGFDPREFTLIVFGGAGAMHGVELARELGIPEVVVPATSRLRSTSV